MYIYFKIWSSFKEDPMFGNAMEAYCVVKKSISTKYLSLL